MRPEPTEEGRSPVLQPYLGRISSFLRVRGDEDKPITFSFGTRMLTLDRWERKAVWQALCVDLEVSTDWQTLVADGAAVLLALVQALERLRGAAQTPARMQALHDLAGAMGVGDMVMEGIRLQLEAAVAGGEVDLAKGLSAFRIKLLEALAEARQAVNAAQVESSQAKATRAAQETPAPPPPTPPPSDPAPDEAALPVAVEADEPAEAPVPARPAGPAVEEPAPASDTGAHDLESYLARAAAFLRSRGKQDTALSIRFGSRKLDLSVWDRRILWQILCDGAAPTVQWHRQVAEGTALRLAILSVLDELDGLDAKDTSAAARNRLLGELSRAVPLATRLAEEIRTSIDGMVASGRSDDARRLTVFRNGFMVVLREGRRTIESARPADPAEPVKPPAPAKPAAKTPTRARLGDTTTAEGTVLPPPPAEMVPYLERATELIRVRGNEERPVTLSVGSRTISFTAWERRVLWQALCQDSAVVSPWAELVARGVAVQLGGLLASERLAQRQSQSDVQEAVRQEMATLANLGNSVLSMLTDEITTQAAGGKIDLVNRLKAFWEKVAESLQAVRRGV